MNESELDDTRNTFLQSVRRAQTAIAALPEPDLPASTPTDLEKRITYRKVADIEAKPIHWLWPARFARGKVSIIAGNPGLGKSQIASSMAAIVTTCGQWPVDRAVCDVGNVVILSAEDDAADTLRPRLEAAGADLQRVFVLDAVEDGPLLADGGTHHRAFNLQKDLSKLGAMLDEIGGAALIVIDPITAYLGNADSHKNAEVRAILAPLSTLAAQHGSAVVCISHLNKGSGNGEAITRVTGSLAFVAAARASFVVTKDPENELRRLFLPLKNNIGNDRSGLSFDIQSASIESLAGTIDTSRVVWGAEAVAISADSAMLQFDPEARGELEDATAFLRELLAEGPLPSKQVRLDAEGAGHNWTTIRRAQKALGIVPAKDGMQGGWFWTLPLILPSKMLTNTKVLTPQGRASSQFFGADEHLREDDPGQVEVEI